MTAEERGKSSKMPIDALKGLIKQMTSKFGHPHAQIGFGSRVSGNTVLGTNVKIGRHCYIHNSTLGENVQIRDDCSIFKAQFEKRVVIYRESDLSEVRCGAFSFVAERSQAIRVTIGRFSSIGPHFLCGFGEHPTDRISTSPVFYSTRKQCGTSFAEADSFAETRETAIGNDVWIGARVFVRDGVRIGHGALVAAGAVVVKDIPEATLWVAGDGEIPAVKKKVRELGIDRHVEFLGWVKDEKKG